MLSSVYFKTVKHIFLHDSMLGFIVEPRESTGNQKWDLVFSRLQDFSPGYILRSRIKVRLHYRQLSACHRSQIVRGRILYRRGKHKMQAI